MELTRLPFLFVGQFSIFHRRIEFILNLFLSSKSASKAIFPRENDSFVVFPKL